MTPALEARFWAKVRKGDGCWEWQAARTPKGYGQFRFSGTMGFAHRFAWIVAHGPIPDGLCVRHDCDNPPCVNPAHLRLGTQGDNVRDRQERGRDYDKHGANNPKARLTEADVREIRRLYAAGSASQSELGRLYAITQCNVSAIVRGQTWTDAGGPVSVGLSHSGAASKRWQA